MILGGIFLGWTIHRQCLRICETSGSIGLEPQKKMLERNQGTVLLTTGRGCRMSRLDSRFNHRRFTSLLMSSRRTKPRCLLSVPIVSNVPTYFKHMARIGLGVRFAYTQCDQMFPLSGSQHAPTIHERRLSPHGSIRQLSIFQYIALRR